jgi:2'-5' RNA ligase
MLYPFVAPDRLSTTVREALAAVAATQSPFDYRLARRAAWPDTIYVAVEPVAPFVALQAALAAAFPAFPIYGADAGFEFMPHVSIAEGHAIDDPATTGDPGWATLPAERRAVALEVILQPRAERWRTIWRVPLGGRQRR